jgi:hypothetical protein
MRWSKFRGGGHSNTTPKDYATGIACGLMVSSVFLGPLGALTLGLSTAPTCLGLGVSYFFD